MRVRAPNLFMYMFYLLHYYHATCHILHSFIAGEEASFTPEHQVIETLRIFLIVLESVLLSSSVFQEERERARARAA